MLPPRPPAKPKPLPKLTADKKAGKSALNTFAELMAFFKPEEAPAPPEAPKPKADVKAEEKPADPPAPPADAPPPDAP